MDSAKENVPLFPLATRSSVLARSMHVVIGAGGQSLDLNYSFYFLIYGESFGKFDFHGKNTRERLHYFSLTDF